MGIDFLVGGNFTWECWRLCFTVSLCPVWLLRSPESFWSCFYVTGCFSLESDRIISLSWIFWILQQCTLLWIYFHPHSPFMSPFNPETEMLQFGEFGKNYVIDTLSPFFVLSSWNPNYAHIVYLAGPLVSLIFLSFFFYCFSWSFWLFCGTFPQLPFLLPTFSFREVFTFQMLLLFSSFPIAFDFYFLDALIFLSLWGECRFVFTFSSLCTSVFSKLLFRELLVFLYIIYNRGFFRCLSSLLNWDGCELIRSSECEREHVTYSLPISVIQMASLLEKLPYYYVQVFFFWGGGGRELGDFRLPGKDFSLCQERKVYRPSS